MNKLKYVANANFPKSVSLIRIIYLTAASTILHFTYDACRHLLWHEPHCCCLKKVKDYYRPFILRARLNATRRACIMSMKLFKTLLGMKRRRPRRNLSGYQRAPCQMDRANTAGTNNDLEFTRKSDYTTSVEQSAKKSQ